MKVSRKYLVASSLGILLFSSFLATNYQLPVHAQSSLCEPGTNPRADGLVSAPDLGGSKFGTSSRACVVEERAAFVSYKIPSFDDLESIYYTQAKLLPTITKHLPQSSGSIDLGGSTDHLYYFTDNVSITSPSFISGNRTGIIFVKKDLNIGPIPSNKVKVGGKESGIVYVVGGNVNIDPTVDEIDGVIIAQGTIFTAGAGCKTSQVSEKSPGSLISPLVINGSLISLSSAAPIQFCRNLDDNSKPAEEILHQAKYLVILKDIFADTLQKWSEIP